jgi:hypothetical protein
VTQKTCFHENDCGDVRLPSVTGLPPSLGERTRVVSMKRATTASSAAAAACARGARARFSCDSACAHRALMRGRVGDGGMLRGDGQAGSGETKISGIGFGE